MPACAWLALSGPCAAQVAGGNVDVTRQSDTRGAANRFLRLRRSEGGDVVALETAVVRYIPAAPATGPAVDLVSEIHVADREYYRRLNERFRDYDVVLYELVAASEEAIPESGARATNPVTALQVGLKRLLDLHFQLDCIDYARPNLLHADLTPREFMESMSSRGESVAQMFFRVLGQAMAVQASDPVGSRDIRLFSAMFSRDRAAQLKRIMAEEFERGLSIASPFEGPGGSTIITVRNMRAMDVLATQIQQGRRRIAIFYGAAHLPDMESRLIERFGLRKHETSWLVAWDIP